MDIIEILKLLGNFAGLVYALYLMQKDKDKLLNVLQHDSEIKSKLIAVINKLAEKLDSVYPSNRYAMILSERRLLFLKQEGLRLKAYKCSRNM